MPSFCTPSGSVRFSRLVQLPNAYDPISVTLLGMLTFSRFVQPFNTESPNFVTLLGNEMLLRLVQFINAAESISVLNDLFVFSSIFTLLSDVHPLKALSPIKLTDFGIFTLMTPVHPKNAYLLILVIPSSTTTFFILSLYLCHGLSL